MKPKIKSVFKTVLFVAALILLAGSCSDNKFKIKGEIYGGEGQSMVLEKSDFVGRWTPLDSTHINKNGAFSFSFPAAPSPDIYRLAINDKYIYIPVDSTETITVNSSLDKFGSDFSLTGSHNAEQLEKFEKELRNAPVSNPDSLKAFKRNIYSNYIMNAQGSILSFYILTKTINGKPVFNPEDNDDRKYFAAVATGFKALRPDDPHTALLEQTAINALKKRNSESGKYRTIEAEEIQLIDIDQQDETGKNVKLSDIAGKGKPVVVIFSLLNHPDSPELNIALANIYRRLNGKAEFYNVSLDNDQYAWREAARNLPWVTVYSPGETSSQDALRYNVFQVPSFYIYNSEGELVSRPLTIEELNKSL